MRQWWDEQKGDGAIDARNTSWKYYVEYSNVLEHLRWVSLNSFQAPSDDCSFHSLWSAYSHLTSLPPPNCRPDQGNESLSLYPRFSHSSSFTSSTHFVYSHICRWHTSNSTSFYPASRRPQYSNIWAVALGFPVCLCLFCSVCAYVYAVRASFAARLYADESAAKELCLSSWFGGCICSIRLPFAVVEVGDRVRCGWRCWIIVVRNAGERVVPFLDCHWQQQLQGESFEVDPLHKGISTPASWLPYILSVEVADTTNMKHPHIMWCNTAHSAHWILQWRSNTPQRPAYKATSHQ